MVRNRKLFLCSLCVTERCLLCSAPNLPVLSKMFICYCAFLPPHPSRGAWIEIHCSDAGTVRQSRRLPMNPADIIKDAVALIKEYAQELSQKEHRDDVESGELIGYSEALSVLQDACSPDMRREIGLDFDIDAAYLNSTKKGGTCCYDLDGKEID